MDLPLFSAFFLAFALTLYVILDGVDLGVGILLFFQPDEGSRDHMVDAITPTWDGNETWMIMAGVTLLAAFPIAYSILLPALYLPIILMLLALGFRGVSFEFRGQPEQRRRKWDFAFAVGSLVAAFMQGLIAGGLMQGVRVTGLRFAGSVLDILHPLPLIAGITLVVGYVVLGAGWLRLKSNSSVQEFAIRSIRLSVPAFTVLFGASCMYAAGLQPTIRSQWAAHSVALPCILGLFALAALTLVVRTRKITPLISLCLGLFLFVLCISGMALIVFPDIVPFSVSVWDAASSPTSQRFVLIGAVVVTPLVLAYSGFAYWIFRGRTPEKGWEE
jgi:cytochrome bd ubiquinol oxidase subunit II